MDFNMWSVTVLFTWHFVLALQMWTIISVLHENVKTIYLFILKIKKESLCLKCGMHKRIFISGLCSFTFMIYIKFDKNSGLYDDMATDWYYKKLKPRI